MARLRAETLRAMIVSAAMGALALTLPLAFHAVGLGSKFLPMLLPLLLNGFLSPLPWAVLTGAAMPLVSALLTGMPPFYPPVALIVCSEGAMLAGVAATIYSLTRPRVWPALIAAVAAGRATAFGLSWVLALKFGLPAAMASSAMLLQGLPGVVLQLVAVPVVLRALSKRKGLLFVDKPESKATLFR